MLRILITCITIALAGGAVVIGMPSNADDVKAKYVEPAADVIQQQQKAVTDAMQNARQMMTDGSLNTMLDQERYKLQSIPTSSEGINFQMPNFVGKARDDQYLSKALASSTNLSNTASAFTATKIPMVLISLSMPTSQIKSLVAEAKTIGAVVIVRGLLDDDFKKTLAALHRAAGNDSGGIAIDPTLFKRFNVTSVPAFVLPLEPVEPCTPKGCPVPRHIKATGSATFQYFLDLVARTGDDTEKAEATSWLAKYGD